MGPVIAQTILQRELYVRTKFTFKLSWEYCLLDPMDIVTITDANLGLSNYPVRVIEIEEDDKGLLAFTCEELVTGVSNPALQSERIGDRLSAELGASPRSRSTRRSSSSRRLSLTGGVSQVWLGASGIDGGGQRPMGRRQRLGVGRQRHLFADRSHYGAPLRQGFLTSSLPAAAGWDSVDTLAVNLSRERRHAVRDEPGRGAAGRDAVARRRRAARLRRRDAHDGEQLQSDRARARRRRVAADGAHSTGAPFARLDGAVVRYRPAGEPRRPDALFQVPELQTSRRRRRGSVDLHGLHLFDDAAPRFYIRSSRSFRADSRSISARSTDAPTLADDFGMCVSAAVDRRRSISAPIVVPVVHPIAAPLAAGSPVDLGLTTGAVTLSDDFGSTNDAVVDIINLGTVP